MNYSVLVDLLPIISTIVAMVVFLLIVMIQTPWKYYFKLIGIPAILALTIFALSTMDDMLGRPYRSHPPDGFWLIKHLVVPISSIETSIQIWALDPNTGTTRLYQIPFSQQIADALNKAEQMQQTQGMPVEGKWPTDEGLNIDFPQTLMLRQLTPSELIPK